MAQDSIAYQDAPEGRVPVNVHYKRLDGTRYGFTVESKLATVPLVIETTLPIGGYESLAPRVVDKTGNMYGPVRKAG